MPERDPTMRPDGVDRPIVQQSRRELVLPSQESDAWTPLESTDTEKPYSPEENARYKAAITKLKATLDGSEENLKRVAHEIRFVLWPLIQRESKGFWNHEIAVSDEYLTNYDAVMRKLVMYLPEQMLQQEDKCLLLVYEQLSDPELVRCSYVFNPANIHDPLKPNWASRESSPKLWIEYADKIIDLLTKPQSAEDIAAAQAFAEKLSKLH